MVDVRCHPDGNSQCQVTVTYTLTGRSEAGDAIIVSFMTGYLNMIEEWQDMILDYLARASRQVSGA